MTVTDPVCGMRIEEEDAVARVEYEGDLYYLDRKSTRLNSSHAD